MTGTFHHAAPTDNTACAVVPSSQRAGGALVRSSARRRLKVVDTIGFWSLPSACMTRKPLCFVKLLSGQKQACLQEAGPGEPTRNTAMVVNENKTELGIHGSHITQRL